MEENNIPLEIRRNIEDLIYAKFSSKEVHRAKMICLRRTQTLKEYNRGLYDLIHNAIATGVSGVANFDEVDLLLNIATRKYS